MRKKIIFIFVLPMVLLIIYISFINLTFVNFKMNNSDLTLKTIKFETNLANKLINNVNSINLIKIPSDNVLTIPRIGISTKIIEGNTINVLNKEEGVWHEFDSATPDKTGNTVIAGHRWQFLPPNTNTFYLLPEIKNNDYIIIYWKGKEYDYIVYDKFEAFPDDQRAYQYSKERILTLYTCTPLFIGNKRVIIKAVSVDL